MDGCVLSAIKHRVASHIDVSLSDRMALTIAMCCGSVDRDALLELSCSGRTATQAIAAADQLAVSHDEFLQLFGSDSVHPQRNTEITKRWAESPEARGFVSAFEKSLVQTMREDAIRCRLQRSSQVQAATYAATHRREHPIGVTEGVLGGFVNSDGRRLEDLCCDLEDDVDLLTLNSAIDSLASTVTI